MKWQPTRRIKTINDRKRSVREGLGFIAIEFVMGLGVLMLPVAILVTVLPTWSERQEMAEVAAREAARTYVITGDSNAAQTVVRDIANNYSLADGGMTLELSGNPRLRSGEVTAIVHVRVPATAIPLLNANADAFTLTKQHVEVVDQYRSFAP